MPTLTLKRAFLDSFDGEIGEHVLNDLSGDSYLCDGQPLTLIQRQFLISRFMTEIRGIQVYLNTMELAAEMQESSRTKDRKQSIDEEQMLDIAEMCFVKMAELLIKKGLTVRDAFGKYSTSDILPESKTVLELVMPSQFLEAIKIELGIRNLSEIEAACLMRVLAKPELDNMIILNEFALIMENFGVPLIDGATLSEEEDYTPDD